MGIMKKNYLLSLTAALALVVAGCSDDLDNGKNTSGPDENGEKVYMTVNISTVSDGMSTKAHETPTNPNIDGSGNGAGAGAGWGEDGNGWLGELAGQNEAKVHDINVFLVGVSGDNVTLNTSNQLNLLNSKNAEEIKIDGYGYYALANAYDASEGGNEYHHGNGGVTMRVTMKKELSETPQNYQVFTIVNAGKQITVLTLKDLRESILDGAVILSNEDNVASADKFVMSTHKMISNNNNPSSVVELSSKNTEDNPASTSVYVERLAARVDLGYPENANLSTADLSASSAVKNTEGNFTLTGYAVVNQWNGSTFMFKQVSPTVSDYINNDVPTTYSDTDPKRYLGKEIWKKTTNTEATSSAGTYNYVLSYAFDDKTINNFNTFKAANSYTNNFNEDLNGVTDLVKPLEDLRVQYAENSTSRTYFPIAYVRENTMKRDNQKHGFSTGVIFRTKFEPKDEFKVTAYADGAINEEGLTKSGGEYVFLTAEHFSGNKVQRVVYKDLKSVAARAFNISSSDTHSLLKGFMEGWDKATSATLEDVKAAINGMSKGVATGKDDTDDGQNNVNNMVNNTLECQFYTYLYNAVKDMTEFTDDLKKNLTYAAFINSLKIENVDLNSIFGDGVNLHSLSSDQIAILSQYYGISLYKDGESYYKFWIRHDDNMRDQVMGVMEFCIVRNNVYQLFVKGVKDLGDPLPYTPGKDDPGTDDEDDTVAIDVTIYVKDWVKRTNKDIVI